MKHRPTPGTSGRAASVLPTSAADAMLGFRPLSRECDVNRLRTAIGNFAVLLIAISCVAQEPEVTLGPTDGRDLPPADTGRVAVGDLAPDFTLASYDRGPITLSEYRGSREVILVFYRGSW